MKSLIVKFLCSLHKADWTGRALSEWMEKNLKTNVRVVIYWESVSNSHLACHNQLVQSGICLMVLHAHSPLSRNSWKLILDSRRAEKNAIIIRPIFTLLHFVALLLNNLGFNDTCVLPFTGAINSQNIFNLCETEEIGSSCQQTRLFKLYFVASDWFMRS